MAEPAKTPKSQIAADMQPFVDGMQGLYSNGSYSDLIISCGERQWDVHKFCVCAQSPFFNNACSKGFKEAEQNKIALDDNDPRMVETLIHFFYNFDYDDNPDSAHGQESLSPMIMNIRMFVLADKYFVNPLQDLAAKKFDERVQMEWNTAAFAAAIMEVYECLMAGNKNMLKRAIIGTVLTKAKDLLHEDTEHQWFLKLFATVPDFGKDISFALMLGYNPGKIYRCPLCSNAFEQIDHSQPFTCPKSCHTKGKSKGFWKTYEHTTPKGVSKPK